jgi:cell division protein ZapA
MPGTEPVRVTIFNQTYSLVASEDSRELQELAETVDDLMHSIARSGNLDSTRTAVLACLHLADQLRTVQRNYEALRLSVEEKAEHCTSLLDRAIAE